MRNFFKYLFIGLIRVYQYTLSPLKHVLFGAHCGCRFNPHCSAYGVEAIQKRGPWKGCWLITKRLLRCHPWSTGGEDPVP